MSGNEPDCSHPDTLAFVAEGFLHRLGNVLFTVQGHAQLLGPDGIERAPGAILSAVERGSAALNVVRTLLGPTDAGPADAGVLLAVIADLVRIPLREAGQTLAIEGLAPAAGEPTDGGAADDQPARFRGVDAATFCPAVLAGVRLLVAGLPAGQSGQVTISLRTGPRRKVSVAIGHVPAAGSLPFPLAADEVARELTLALRSRPRKPRISAATAGIELVFGAVPRPPEGAADQTGAG